MRRAVGVLAWLLCFLLANAACGGERNLLTASGTVSKVTGDTLTIRPRDPDGRFGKNLLLKLTGTSKITSLSEQKRGGKLVFVQRDTDAKDLEPNRQIAVIYAAGQPPVLLSAVVLPAK